MNIYLNNMNARNLIILRKYLNIYLYYIHQ